jgi:hypothetical protein
MNSVSKDVIDKIIKIVKDGGGEVYEQPGYINFCGVRNNKTDNTFNDSLYIYWKDTGDGEFKCVTTTGFTTKPGKSVVLGQKCRNSNGGAAILKEGWQKDIWHIGKHQNKYKALRSTGGVTKPTVITRDNTQYDKGPNYELRIFENKTSSGYYGINFHKSGNPKGNAVNNWSAGCQVFQYQSEFNEMLQMAESANSKGQKTFSYFLTNKKVFEENGIDTNSSGGTKFDFEQSQFSGKIDSREYNNLQQYSNDVSNLSNHSLENTSPTNPYGRVESSRSFGTKVIFGQVFPDDDNNRYIEMSSEDISVIQYADPNLKVEDLNISNVNYATSGLVPDKISYYTPVVFINEFMIPQTNITNFCLDYSSFVPQVMVEFVDMKNDMLSTNIPKPGSYIKVYIGGYGDENYYKPIRQDFVITNIIKTNKTGGEYQNYRNSGNPIKYKFTGILNIPLGFRKMSWSSSKINARQAMFNISNTVGLGFATNFSINSNVDVMRWINTQNKSYCDFMKEITQHSCYSPYTFFTSFIDQYYVLNFIECRRLLSHGGNKNDVPQMIYNCIMPEMTDNKEDSVDENLNSGEQKVSYYFLTNNEDFKGWTNYIEEYYEINDGYSMLSDGYNKTLTYSDKCGFLNLSSKNYKFRLTPIDNMKRGDDKNILPLPDQVTHDTYIPLNLRQTTSTSYVDSQSLYDNPSATESMIDLGEIDTSNNFPLYFYASVQNDFQMKNLKKCGLSVRLQNYNPAITRYSRIWIDIYDMNRNSLTQIRKNDDFKDIPESKLKDILKNTNENIISFKEDFDEGVEDTEYRVYNRSLSGWYVVTDMKISYNTVKDFNGVTYKKLQTQLILNRIEYKPSFNTEYEIAKKAIEKYTNDNLSENIMCGGDSI